jgi:hypothetical protein
MAGAGFVWVALFWASLVVALLRWPGRTIGLAVGLCLWTMVGPWAFWATVAVLAGVAVGRRRSLGRVGSGGLLARPRVAAVVLSAAVVVLAPSWWFLVGLVGLVLSGWWLLTGLAGLPFASGLAPRRSGDRQGERPARRRKDAVADQAVVLVAEIEDFLQGDGDPARGGE